MADSSGLTVDPNSKLKWLLENDLLKDFRFRHEAFLIIQKAFLHASDDMKQAVWDTGWAAYEQSVDPDRPYPPNFALWVSRIDPDFQPAATAVAQFAEEHPGWVPSDHPELINYMGEISEIPPSALPAEIDAAPTYRAIRQLELADQSAFGLSNLQDAVAVRIGKDPYLGVALIDGLIADEAWDSVLWQATRYGLDRVAIPDELWPRILGGVAAHPDTNVSLEILSSVLLDAIEAERPSIVSATFEGAAHSILGLLERFIVEGRDDNDPRGDLMFAALNSWSGRLASYFVQTAVVRESDHADPCAAPGLEGFIKVVIDSADKNWGRIAIGALGRFLPYLLERCPVMATQFLTPTFDWATPPVAKAAWQGAVYTRWSRRTVEALYPYLPDTARHLGDFEGQSQHGLCNALAGVGLAFDEDPTETGGWLSALVLGNDDSTRATFARFFLRNLESLSETDRSAIWNRWLREWWTNRAEGFPAEIGPEEASMTLGWILPLEPHLHEIVPLVTAVPLSGRDFGFLHKLKESDLPSLHPTETVQLVTHVLRAPPQWWHQSEFEGILRVANDHGADPAVLRDACDAVLGLGGQRPDFCPDV